VSDIDAAISELNQAIMQSVVDGLGKLSPQTLFAATAPNIEFVRAFIIQEALRRGATYDQGYLKFTTHWLAVDEAYFDTATMALTVACVPQIREFSIKKRSDAAI
jgi:hypothetical protein